MRLANSRNQDVDDSSHLETESLVEYLGSDRPDYKESMVPVVQGHMALVMFCNKQLHTLMQRMKQKENLRVRQLVLCGHSVAILEMSAQQDDTSLQISAG